MNIHERLAERKRTEGSVPRLDDAEITAVVAALKAHPEWDRVYLYFDGSIEGPDAGLKVPGSRTESLVSISQRGFPAAIGRGHSQIEGLL